jgi:glucan phosphoethanolaminetransferase (alkaline phosphatase superfamily)
MLIKKNILYFLFFVAVATLFIGIAFTSADFFTSPTSQLKDRFILFIQWCVLVGALLPVIYLIALNKYVFALFYPLICMLSSILMYFRYATGTTLTTMILDAALDNDIHISVELISSGLVAIFFSSLFIAILFVVYRFKRIQNPNRIYWHYFIALILLFAVFSIPKIKRPVSERIPFNFYYITARYLSEKSEILTERNVLTKDVLCGEEEDLLVLLVVGESLRSDHLGFNGYKRNTTPYLFEEDIISFPHIYSEYTHTNASLPHILTRADSLHPDRANEERSFIDIFKQCGYYTVWLANQEPAKTYVYFMKECDTLIYANLNKSPYVFDKWTDGDLLPSFDSFVENEQKKQFILMHTIGSHWYYNSHFPDEFQKYTPVTKSRIVNANTREEMINSYDNTVLYTDYFVYELINRLRNKNAILFYLSDHGEALGEDGIWLHAVDCIPTHYPACWIWMSPQYKKKNPEKYNVLQVNKERQYYTDFLFHTILEAAGIKSEIINKSFSLFYPYP